MWVEFRVDERGPASSVPAGLARRPVARGPNRVERALGVALEWGIQRWVATTGRLVEAGEARWLAGPIGGATIGERAYAEYAASVNLVVGNEGPETGLLATFDALAGPRFRPEQVDPAVRDFYERTSDYTLDVWSEWSGPLRLFARTLVYLVSRNIEQLNLPLSPLDAGYGMSSRIIPLVDERGVRSDYAGWLRSANVSGAVIYAGFYTTEIPPGHGAPCVKVVFPLPNGSATVFLRPVNGPGGSLRLVSAGRIFGDPGYYRLHRVGEQGRLRAQYLPLRETIDVYSDGRDRSITRADHTFRFGPFTFLRLRYRMSRRTMMADGAS
jgi:hypothetical protein